MKCLSIPGRFAIAGLERILIPNEMESLIDGESLLVSCRYDIPECYADTASGLRDFILVVQNGRLEFRLDQRPRHALTGGWTYDHCRDLWCEQLENRFSCLAYRNECFRWLVDWGIVAPMPRPDSPLEEGKYLRTFYYGHDLKSRYRLSRSNGFEIFFVGLRNLWWTKWRSSIGNIRRTHRFFYDSIRIWTWDVYPFLRDRRIGHAMRLSARFDAIFDPDQWPSRVRDRYYCTLINQQALRNFFPYSHYFDKPLPMRRWDYVFDTFGRQYKRYDFHWQSLVRPGWRIMARNLATSESSELGFIDFDAADRSLTDILLPDGEYEISVLTSALFWTDARDRHVHTLILPTGENATTFPTIYNLRSAVSGGATGIYWSATYSEIDDCVFGIWYSPESPVDIDREPDATVWYNSSMAEYQAAFVQSEQQYVAVAAMKIGEEKEIGKVHELFLDWSDRPLRAPDDVIVLDEPLPVFDKEVEAAHEDDPFLALWH